MLDTFVDINDVFLVVDDRDKVVKMWRDLGLNTFQVAPGNFQSIMMLEVLKNLIDIVSNIIMILGYTLVTYIFKALNFIKKDNKVLDFIKKSSYLQG